MRVRRNPPPAMLLLLLICGAAGCGSDDPRAAAEGSPNVPAGTVRLDGSSTVAPIMMTAAELFGEKFPQVRVSVGVSGTGGGFKRFLDPHAELRTDISNASRPIKPEEIDSARQIGVAYIELPIALDGIALVVNPGNDFCDHLTVAELQRIWSPGSTIRHWSEIRPEFPDLPLRLYGPGSDSGTFDYFTEAVNGKAKACRSDYTASENDNVLVQGVSGDPGGLGYFGFSYYESNAARVRLLAVDSGNGIPIRPSLETIRTGSYSPLSRPLFCYVNTDAAGRPEVQAFLGMFFDRAAEIVEQRRDPFVALDASMLGVVRDRFARRVVGTAYADAGSAPLPLLDRYRAAAKMPTHETTPHATSPRNGTGFARGPVVVVLLFSVVAAWAMRRAVQSARWSERLIEATLFGCALLSVLTTLGIVWVLLSESIGFFRAVSLREFLTASQWAPLLEPRHYGILPLLAGTMLVAAGALVVALPIGLATAIFLSEYAPPWLCATAKPILEILAGIPTVVYGYFALTFITPHILRPILPQTEVFNAASASIVVGVMIIPTICSLCDDAFRAVPRTLREAAYALSATKLEVSTRIVLPAALSGVVAAVLLGLARAIGETMAVALAAGMTPKLTLNPLESIQTMTGYIVQVSMGDAPAGSIQYQTIFAVGLSLFAITLLINLVAQRVMEHFREAYE